jgi:hypothetical protein
MVSARSGQRLEDARDDILGLAGQILAGDSIASPFRLPELRLLSPLSGSLDSLNNGDSC